MSSCVHFITFVVRHQNRFKSCPFVTHPENTLRHLRIHWSFLIPVLFVFAPFPLGQGQGHFPASTRVERVKLPSGQRSRIRSSEVRDSLWCVTTVPTPTLSLLLDDSLDNDLPAPRHHLSYPRIQMHSNFILIGIKFTVTALVSSSMVH